MPTALRERAFFSATIEDARWLQQRMNFLEDTLANTTAVNEKGEKYFKAGGRAKFIEEAQADAIRSGLRSTTDPNELGGLKDIRSETRLGLIYDTNLKAAQDYGYWKQGQDPDVLQAFPSQRFIRVQAVRKPRQLHQAYRNEVRRKDDLKFWLAMNSPVIGGFDVPWGPWGYRSGMDVEDVARDESDALGLTKPGETMKPVVKDFNDQLQASTQNLAPRLVNLLKIAFGDRVVFTAGSVKWRALTNDDLGLAPISSTINFPDRVPFESARATLDKGLPVTSPIEDLRFGSVALDYLETKADSKLRLELLQAAVETTRNPIEIWNQGGQNLYIGQFVRPNGNQRALIVTTLPNGEVKNWYLKNPAQLDRQRKGISLRYGQLPGG